MPAKKTVAQINAPARYQYSWETLSNTNPKNDQKTTKKINRKSAGPAKKLYEPNFQIPAKKRGGKNLEMIPDLHQVKVGGMMINTGRGEVMDTEQAMKPMNAAGKKLAKGLFSDIGSAIDTVGTAVGLGKKKGMGMNSHEVMGGGFFSDIGNTIDSIGSAIGLGKKKGKKGGAVPTPTVTNEYQQNVSENQNMLKAGKKPKGKKGGSVEGTAPAINLPMSAGKKKAKRPANQWVQFVSDYKKMKSMRGGAITHAQALTECSPLYRKKMGL